MIPQKNTIKTQMWHSHSIEEVVQILQTDLSKGLTHDEVRERLKHYCPNELKEMPRPGFLRMIIDQFNNFLVLLLVVASVVSFFLGEYLDASAILAIVVLNAVLGVVQESKAEKALAALREIAAPDARVLRDGSVLTTSVREIVPGDVVLLDTGNYVPADVRLVETHNLRINESSLTGESVPVEKKADEVLTGDIPIGDRNNLAYMSTLVTYGRGKGVVIATGMDTQFGMIAEMIQEYKAEPTPLQVRLDQLGKWLGIAALAVCGVVFVMGVMRGLEILEMFLTAVSLAIAAVPEGLPAVVTICLALGMQHMIGKNALVRKLTAVETLGSTTVICSDKTGTLTQNRMTAVQLYVYDTMFSITGRGYCPHGTFHENGSERDINDYPDVKYLLQKALLCNDAILEKDKSSNDHDGWRVIGDPTEGALVVAAAKAGLWREGVEKEWPRIAEIPFDSERKCMTTLHKVTSDDFHAPYIALVKGAPDVILGLCTDIHTDGHRVSMDQEDRQHILEVNEKLATNALRVLAVAYRQLNELSQNSTSHEVERELTFGGLIGMIDPARLEAKPAVEIARKAGIRSVMITGDYPNTAKTIAHEIGILRKEGVVLTGAELDKINDMEFLQISGQVDVYARVSPQHKVRIVETLRHKGEIVAMTGDGINDAPALKRSDIGVAMGITGTDVSKETADMVLTDDNYASIVSAVEEGRIIYSNIRKFVYFLLSCNIGEILTIFLAILFRLPLPLTAIQLLVVNLITDGAPALALGLEKGDPDVMERPPRHPKEPVIRRDMIAGMVVQSVAMTVGTLTAFVIGLQLFPNNQQVAKTMAFATLSISQLFMAYTSRSERHSLWAIGPLSNKYMQWAVASSLIILIGIIYIPFLNPIFNTTFLGLQGWLIILPLIMVPAVAAEINKMVLRWRG